MVWGWITNLFFFLAIHTHFPWADILKWYPPTSSTRSLKVLSKITLSIGSLNGSSVCTVKHMQTKCWKTLTIGKVIISHHICYWLSQCSISLKHYIHLIHEYGSPNGLCSSITENKHIKAVKKPWWHSSKYKAMRQMLLTNQWFDKLSVSCAHFTANSMLHGDCLSETLAMLHKLYYFSTELTAVNK